jgi:hypothetical protein
MTVEAFNTHDWEKEPGPVPDFNYPDWTCKRCGARWNKLFGDYGTGANNYCQEPGSEDMKEPWKDGSPVAGERRWEMYWLNDDAELPFEGYFEADMACMECAHCCSVPSVTEPCASCTVRPSGFEEVE